VSDKPTNNPFAALRDKLGPLPPGPAAAPANARDAEKPKEKRYSGRVTVRRERSGRGGKAVTLAEGPGLSGHPLEKLAKELARSLGTGARVENNALVVQGDQPDRVVAWLTEHGFAEVQRGN
jgi:translation initiation factor 1